MPRSLSAMYVQLVFSTKDRRLLLSDKSIRAQVHSYLGGISGNSGSALILIGGLEDHVHVLAWQMRKENVAAWVRHIKPNSTNWIHGKGWGLARFAWQSVYGVFSVNSADINKVCTNIENQENRHRMVTFQDEFRAILQEHDSLGRIAEIVATVGRGCAPFRGGLAAIPGPRTCVLGWAMPPRWGCWVAANRVPCISSRICVASARRDRSSEGPLMRST